MNEIRRGDSTGRFLAFLAGAATGAAVALLTAPRSGRETRDRLKVLARDVAGRLGRVPSGQNEAYDRAAHAARRAFLETLENTKPDSGSETGRSGH
jgi:gas vesicle protein